MPSKEDLPMFTHTYVENRIDQLTQVIMDACVELGSPKAFSDSYFWKMYHRQYVNGDNPSLAYRLKIAKRLARVFIKNAIMCSDGYLLHKKNLHAAYLTACEDRIATVGHCDLFSFESYYAKELKVDFNEYKHLFKITPKV